MTPPIAIVDCETTALGHLARPWEIAVVHRHAPTADGDRPADTERVWQVEYTPATLPPGTSPEALHIGRWHNRGATDWLFSAYDTNVGVSAGPEWAIARDVHRFLDGAVIIGVGVHFDAAVLSNMFRRHGLPEEPWHYAIVDLKAATWGWFNSLVGTIAADALQLSLPMRSEQLAAALGVLPPPPGERHTALGDARWAARWYDALTGGTP